MEQMNSTGWARAILTLFAAAAVICAARAQDMPSEFVVSGQAAFGDRAAVPIY